MPNYAPTEHDAVTGRNLRALRKRRGETLEETVERSGFKKSTYSLSAVERGKRRLTELEATQLAAHFGTTPAMIFASAPPWTAQPEPVSEQEWLGYKPRELFAVPDRADKIAAELGAVTGRTLTIDLDRPLTPDEYRMTVWLPYLEARYATDMRKTG